MRSLALVVILLACACGKDNSPNGLCTRSCKKAMECMNQESQVQSCIDSCLVTPPEKERVEGFEAMSCAELMRVLNGGSPAAAPAAAPAANGCTADCRGCVGDNSSCYAAAGGANGIPCDPCCCAPGGPAPTWKTEE